MRVAPLHLDDLSLKVDRAVLVKTAPAMVGPSRATSCRKAGKGAGMQKNPSLHLSLL
jgi:hypothetical protein